MKLAEFFVSLGFQMDGEKSLDKLDEKLGDLAGNAAKALAGFASLTAGMGVMLHQAMETANGFRRFSTLTGLSSEELQKWQYVATQAGVSGEEIASTMVAMQKQAAEIARGGGNPNAWAMLGLSPSANPMETIANLREAIKGLSPAIARTMVENLGVGEGVFAMLEMTDQKFQQLQKDFVLSTAQTKEINKISAGWSEVVFQINAVKNQLVAALIPALKPVLDVMKIILAKFAEFTQWLNKSSTGAKIVKTVLAVLAGLIVVITVGLTSLLGVLGAVTAATAAWSIASLPITGTMIGIALAVAGLALILEDLWTSYNGGKGVLVDQVAGLQELLDVIKDLVAGYEHLERIWTKLTMKKDAMSNGSGNVWSDDPEEMRRMMQMKIQNNGGLNASGTDAAWLKSNGVSLMDMLNGNPSAKLNGMNAPRAASESTMSSKTNIGAVNIEVNGANGDPYKAGGIIADRLRELEDTVRQQPAY